LKPLLTPHGQGFSFVDSCEILEAGKRARGVKWLDPKSSYFADHFPGNPLLPAVFLVESAAQTAGVLWQSGKDESQKLPLFLAQIQQFRITKAVFPGQTLEINVNLEKDFGLLAQFEAKLMVECAEVAFGKLILSRERK
jgi:3-hydroxyacyl-[acyl-carrier-protein] dehydratase